MGPAVMTGLRPRRAGEKYGTSPQWNSLALPFSLPAQKRVFARKITSEWVTASRIAEKEKRAQRQMGGISPEIAADRPAQNLASIFRYMDSPPSGLLGGGEVFPGAPRAFYQMQKRGPGEKRFAPKFREVVIKYTLKNFSGAI